MTPFSMTLNDPWPKFQDYVIIIALSCMIRIYWQWFWDRSVKCWTKSSKYQNNRTKLHKATPLHSMALSDGAVSHWPQFTIYKPPNSNVPEPNFTKRGCELKYCSYKIGFSFPIIPPPFRAAAVQRRRSLNVRSKKWTF